MTSQGPPLRFKAVNVEGVKCFPLWLLRGPEDKRASFNKILENGENYNGKINS